MVVFSFVRNQRKQKLKYQNYPELARIAQDGIRHRKPIPSNNAKKIVRQRLKHADQRSTRKIKGRGPKT